MSRDPVSLAATCQDLANEVRAHFGPESEQHMQELQRLVAQMMDAACQYGCPSAQASSQDSQGEASQAGTRSATGIEHLLDSMAKVGRAGMARAR